MSRLFDDASTQYLLHSAAVVTAAPTTFSIWFYQDDTAVNCSIFKVGDTDALSGFGLNTLSGPGAIQWQSRLGGTNRTVDSTANWSANTWHHALGMEISAASRKIYLDGGNDAENTPSVTPTNIDNAAIGAWATNSAVVQHFSGMLAHGAFWDAELNTSEIAALAGGVLPIYVRPQNLVAYWPLINAGSPEIDYWRGRYPMTLNGGPTVGTSNPPVQLLKPQIWTPYEVSVAPPVDEKLPDKIKIIRSNQIPIPQLQL
jgi:hypothetical protein